MQSIKNKNIMNKELTPMQELISKLHPDFFTEEEANYYLQKEKQVIEEAFDRGVLYGYSNIYGKHHYNTKFNNK